MLGRVAIARRRDDHPGAEAHAPDRDVPQPGPLPELALRREREAATEVLDARSEEAAHVPPLAGEEARNFNAVVKPERVKTHGNAAAEIERLRKEIARAEGMLSNDRFAKNAPARVVDAEREKLERYRRELDALTN